MHAHTPAQFRTRTPKRTMYYYTFELSRSVFLKGFHSLQLEQKAGDWLFGLGLARRWARGCSRIAFESCHYLQSHLPGDNIFTPRFGAWLEIEPPCINITCHTHRDVMVMTMNMSMCMYHAGLHRCTCPCTHVCEQQYHDSPVAGFFGRNHVQGQHYLAQKVIGAKGADVVIPHLERNASKRLDSARTNARTHTSKHAQGHV